MKWLYLSLGVAVAAAVIAGGISVFRRRISVQNDDDIDGGVVKRYWSDAPKVIASKVAEISPDAPGALGV